MRKFSEKKCGTICRLYNRQIVKFGKFERLSHTVEISVYMRKFQQYGKAFRTYRTRETKSTSKSYPQFKLFNRMHIIFANFDICLTFTWHFLTSISSFTQFPVALQLTSRADIVVAFVNVHSLVTRYFPRN